MGDQRKAQLRSQLRAKRRALSDVERESLGSTIAAQVSKLALFNRARHIALYLPQDGEVPTGALVHAARSRGKHLYLPVLAPGALLRFARWERQTPLSLNRYGIPEPVPGRSQGFPRRRLDLVLMPLVGFDEDGNRLGMGGGFYDRSFAYRCRGGFARPHLLGLAFDCQCCAALPSESWDVPLDAIVTESRVIRPRLAG